MRSSRETCNKKKTVPKEIPASPENAFGLVSSCFLFLLKYPAYPVLPVFVANTGVLEVQPMIASAVASEERRRSTFIFCYFKRISVVVGRWLLVAGCWLLVVGWWSLVVGWWSLIVSCWLLVAGWWLLVAGCWLLVGIALLALFALLAPVFLCFPASLLPCSFVCYRGFFLVASFSIFYLFASSTKSLSDISLFCFLQQRQQQQ